MAAGAANDGQRFCTFCAKERRADGGCSFMDADGYCNYAYTIAFGKSTTDGGRRKEGADAKVCGKRPNEEGGGDIEEKKQRQG